MLYNVLFIDVLKLNLFYLKICFTYVIISNENLYKRCDSVNLSECIPKARWKLLGHILRSADNTPAALAFKFAVTTRCKGRQGRRCKNLFTTIAQNELKSRDLIKSKLKSLHDLTIR